jgi:MoxR-like ATPase
MEPLPAPLRNPRLHDPKLYRPSKGLEDAVQVALLLGQPLLVTGEPGTGKTELARFIADRYGLGAPFVFNAQTSSAATDLFYKYDALAHFQYSHIQGAAALSPAQVEEKFVRYQALGAAIRAPQRSVVLIDEVDKAPRDLPNDVLAAIEKLEFRVPEVGQTYSAAPENRPIIVLTSNSEKNLPDAFLRRVVYYHIPFPKAAELLEILHSKLGSDPEKQQAGYEKAALDLLVAHFEDIRNAKQLRKNPATAELIQWVSLLHHFGFQPAVLEGKLGAEDRAMLLKSYPVLAKNKDDLQVLAERAKKL